ncbi:MAG: hypothetical protein ACPHXR_00705 [Flavicella sp.]
MTLPILASIVLPALIIGALAYYFFNTHLKNENNKRNFELSKESRKHTLPLQLQAYERVTIFLERINPSSLLVRTKPIGEDKENYKTLLVKTIEQEYEHNLSQQIFIDDACWNVIVSSKNATTNIISNIANDNTIKTAQEMREGILKKMLETAPPSSTALSYIKKEVLKLL